MPPLAIEEAIHAQLRDRLQSEASSLDDLIDASAEATRGVAHDLSRQ
jgi:hypothetical protein